MVRRILGTLVCVAMFAGSELALAADTRTVVQFSAPRTCTTMSVAELTRSYFQDAVSTFESNISSVANICGISQTSGFTGDQFAVILFVGKPSPGAEKAEVVHVILDRKIGEVVHSTTLPGVKSARWVYLSDDPTDRPHVVLIGTPADNPIVAQIGPLAAAILPKIPFAILATKPPASGTVQVFENTSVKLPFTRGSLAESDFIDRVMRNGKGEPVKIGDDDKPVRADSIEAADRVQVDGTFTITNTPLTWINVTAGVGVLSGRVSGAQRAKVEDKVYASDPLEKAATFAGVTLHVPYDSSLNKPSWKESLGGVVGVVMTPAGGFYLGGSAGWRGLSLTVGGAWMWVNTVPSDKKIGDSVADQGDQLVSRRAKALIVGGTYAFGG